MPHWDHQIDHPKGNPGSIEADKRGCLCPVLDNGHGRLDPVMRKHRGFVVRTDCPVHGATTEDDA